MLRQMIVKLGLEKNHDLNNDKSRFMLYLHECAACLIVCTIKVINW